MRKLFIIGLLFSGLYCSGQVLDDLNFDISTVTGTDTTLYYRNTTRVGDIITWDFTDFSANTVVLTIGFCDDFWECPEATFISGNPFTLDKTDTDSYGSIKKRVAICSTDNSKLPGEYICAKLSSISGTGHLVFKK